MFAGIFYQNEVLNVLDQRVLPGQESWLRLTTGEEVAEAIEAMAVRGAPAIAAAALFGLALDGKSVAVQQPDMVWSQYRDRFHRLMERLKKTRPTAVNLFAVMLAMEKRCLAFFPAAPLSEVAAEILNDAQQYFRQDLERNRAIGAAGADFITTHLVRHSSELSGKSRLTLMTHCNTGSLATGGYGTALGVVRALFGRGEIRLVYVNETRPWLQGARLTAHELRSEGIPYKLIVDSAAAFAMKNRGVDAVVVGADRIAGNGDTANKIGTYQLAVSAAYHGIDFYVAASLDTIDGSIESGNSIPIEERGADEIRKIGDRRVSPSDAPVWNPSFDVTPGSLIRGIITETGVFEAPYAQSLSSVGGLLRKPRS